MAPTSKPSTAQPQPVLKDNGFAFHQPHKDRTRTKENTNTKTNTNAKNNKSVRKGLEILDFHESWLEEVELYKEQLMQREMLMDTQYHYATPLQNHQMGSHYNTYYNKNGYNKNGYNINYNKNNGNYHIQSNASSHNSNSSSNKGNHTTHDNHISYNNFNNKTNHNTNNGKNNTYNINNNNNNTNTMLKSNKHNEVTNNLSNSAESGKRRGYEQTKAHKPPRIITAVTLAAAAASASATASASAAAAAAAAAADAQQQDNLRPSFPKRLREESRNGKSAIRNKRHAHSNARTRSDAQFNKTPSKTIKDVMSGGDVLSPPPPPPPQVKPNKIIVSQFHASTLLNSQKPDEKLQLLTQHGLTKSAASAYETSLYASNYLQDKDNRDRLNRFAKYPNIEHVNYVGVSLAKIGIVDRPQEANPILEDDPCAGVDEVNNYSDSESDEEYMGYPFYLEEDGNETHQSRYIRFNGECTSTTSEDSEEDHLEYYRPRTILTPSLFPNVPPYLNFSSHAARGPSMPSTLHKVLKWKLSPVMPKIVKRVVLNSGFRIIKNTTDWMAIWEKHMKSPGFRTIRSHQKYNHMPGSFRIGRKDTMWRSIYTNMKKYGTKEFGFMQKSYIMPDDLEHLRQVWPKNASKLTKWIVKPPASARGTGIRIVNKWSQFPKDRPLVVQKYIERPLLINDSKFDMRLYVVVTSINPLRIYMYKDGLARFASVKYSSELNSLDDRCMHLTNYSINKFSQNYSKNEDVNACQGHKWTLQSLWSCLEARGINTKRLWATLRNLVIKAIISGESGLNKTYRQNVNFRYNCFELFGFDVLLDENLIPWLLEINISPSLHSELPLDLHVKGPLIQAVLNTALYQVPPKLSEQQQQEILDELKLKGPLCLDKRIFTTCLTTEEVRKHNLFTSSSIEFREEYLDGILDNLQPDDVRCLLLTEDEYARCKPLERVFPTSETHVFLKYIENPRYYNRLLDAWEHKFSNSRSEGIALLRRLCKEGYHLQVSDATLEKEPNVTLTEIDMLYTRKEDPLDNVAQSDSKLYDTISQKTAPPKVLSASTGTIGIK